MKYFFINLQSVLLATTTLEGNASIFNTLIVTHTKALRVRVI